MNGVLQLYGDSLQIYADDVVLYLTPPVTPAGSGGWLRRRRR